jgi:uncharacterized protein (DUF362 family)
MTPKPSFSDAMDPAIFRIGKGTSEGTYRALSDFGYKPRKKRILIKPNIAGAYHPGSAYITSTGVVEGTIRYLQDMGITDIAVGEGPVSTDSPHIFRKSGYSRMCKKTGAKLIDFYDTERVRMMNETGEFSVPGIVLDSEYINIAKLKTHINTGVSLCLKNQKGLLSLDEKRASHMRLHQSIASLYGSVRPDFSMIDATSGVEGNGPGAMGREVRNLNLLVMGTSALMVDFTSSMLIGVDPLNVKHLRMAARGRPPRFHKETLDLIERHRMRFRPPSDHHRRLNTYFWWSDETCSGCTCAIADIKGQIIRNPARWPGLFHNGVLKRMDIVTGKGAVPRNHGKVICVGNCTRELAKRNGFAWIPGCPPRTRDIVKQI